MRRILGPTLLAAYVRGGDTTVPSRVLGSRRRGVLVVAVGLGAAAALLLVGCGSSTDAADLLSRGADESELQDNSTSFEIPEGEQRLSAQWFEDEETDALDINSDVVARLESKGFDVSCVAPGQQPDTGAPLVTCSFSGADGGEGTYVLQGGGPAPDSFDTDLIAINLGASIFTS